eukprot:TRINITY_DN18791_c0_g1_i1.p1 TRINITY_DN18791_c0_g1~~TRINITY_DN18791_c0_g1_i1.p1  ORF type:complete len:487 (-),score=97.17 TRINITY_DN18791_c0_g1_i1:173-1564(-)
MALHSTIVAFQQCTCVELPSFSKESMIPRIIIRQLQPCHINCKHCSLSKRSRFRLRNCSLVLPRASPSSSAPSATDGDKQDVTSAEEAINLGLSLFKKARVKDALVQFEKALSLHPNAEEAKVALYNKACCHSYREEGEKAAEALRKALRDYGLKFGVILNDRDMAPFRAMPEFKELQNEARMGGQEVGSSFRRDLKLLSEVRAPFRAVRRFFYLSLCAAAGIAMFFTVPRLIRAIYGGNDAPDIWETVGNAAINIGGIIVLLALFIWDNKKEEEQMAQISREEVLSRLPLRLSTNRIVELAQLREACRPLILAGKKEEVDRAIQQAEKFRIELVKRGILIVPVIWSSQNEQSSRKKGFGRLRKPFMFSSSDMDEFEKKMNDISVRSIIDAERRFKAEVVSPEAWRSWVYEQQESEGVEPGKNAFIVLRLDGRVRKSGLEMPDWKELINEIPPLESLISKLEK